MTAALIHSSRIRLLIPLICIPIAALRFRRAANLGQAAKLSGSTAADSITDLGADPHRGIALQFYDGYGIGGAGRRSEAESQAESQDAEMGRGAAMASDRSHRALLLPAPFIGSYVAISGAQRNG